MPTTGRSHCKLCLAYGEPTTGVAPFLDGGSLVLQVSERVLAHRTTPVCLPLVRDGVDTHAATGPTPWRRCAATSPMQQLLAADTARQSAAFDAPTPQVPTSTCSTARSSPCSAPLPERAQVSAASKTMSPFPPKAPTA